MIFTKQVLEQHFDETGEADAASTDCGFLEGRTVHYDVREGFECWINDKYQFDILEVMDNGRAFIFDNEDGFWREVSEGAALQIYKIERNLVAKYV